MKSGREQLRDWIAKREMNQREAADFLGMNEVHFGQILNGVRQAGLNTAIKIEEHTGIPIKSWRQSAKRSAQRSKQGEAKRAVEPAETAEIARR